MTGIQIVLIIGAFGALYTYLTHYRSVIRDRLIALGLFLLAIVAIISPESTNKIANVVGVGRGADLVMYLFIIATVFALLMMYTKVLRLSESYTQLVRAIALQTTEDRESNKNEGRA